MEAVEGGGQREEGMVKVKAAGKETMVKRKGKVLPTVKGEGRRQRKGVRKGKKMEKTC